MRYRIENVHVPEHPGVAPDGGDARDLPGRVIVHVLTAAPAERGGGMDLKVLTEEDDGT